MIKIARLTLNAFGENTYILIGDNNHCIIVDAGCNNPKEEEQIMNFIASNSLSPIKAINTHAHLDHICGVNFLKNQYGIEWGVSDKDSAVLGMAQQSAMLYGFDMGDTPVADFSFSDGDKIELDGDEIEVIATPGHSAGGVCFYMPSSGILISGDTLFRGSIGRTDLPTGDYDELMKSIVTRILPLGDSVKVLAGHGDSTTVGEEKVSNPFVSEYLTNSIDQITTINR